MTYRIPANDLCMSEAMPFQQHWEARIPIKIEDLGNLGDAMHSRYSSFMTGDEIKVCAFTDRSWTTLTELATFRVVRKTSQRLFVALVSPILAIPKDEIEKANALPIVKLKVVRFLNSYEVRDEAENVIEVFGDENEALAFANRESARTGDGKAAPLPKEPKTQEEKTIASLRIEKTKTGRFAVLNSENETVREFTRASDANQFAGIS